MEFREGGTTGFPGDGTTGIKLFFVNHDALVLIVSSLLSYLGVVASKIA